MCALLAVPNFSEGRNTNTIEAIAAALTQDVGVRLLDVHSDADHNRTVYTLTGDPAQLARALTDGARQAITLIDLNHHSGAHPRVGALDVAPLVHTTPEDRGRAAAAALLTADRLGHELNLPVFLYGALAGGRTRAELRRGGPDGLRQRVAQKLQTADFGPRYGLHPTAGATLVAARPPLVAFHVELEAPATLVTAQQIAAAIRETASTGIRGLRAIGIELTGPGGSKQAQVSTNIEDARAGAATQVLHAIAEHARPRRAELVGLAPRRVFDGWPEEIEIANRRHLEDLL